MSSDTQEVPTRCTTVMLLATFPERIHAVHLLEIVVFAGAYRADALAQVDEAGIQGRWMRRTWEESGRDPADLPADLDASRALMSAAGLKFDFSSIVTTGVPFHPS